MERGHQIVESADAHDSATSDATSDADDATTDAARDADLPTRLRQAYVAHALADLLPARRNAFAKRALDLTLGLLLLAVALPLIGALALAIRLGWLGRVTPAVSTRATGPNVALPVFVRQRYAGRGGRVFVGASLPALRAPRLRRLAWLPLLLNVVRGEMSLVGPRPALYDEWMAQGGSGSLLREAHALARLYVKPGLIGADFVQGAGDARATDDVTACTDPDLHYVVCGSFARDLTVLARAPLALLCS